MQKVEFDNALNEAGWAFVDAWNVDRYGGMSGHLWNDCKPILRDVIQCYVDAKAKEPPADEDWYARYRRGVEA